MRSTREGEFGGPPTSYIDAPADRDGIPGTCAEMKGSSHVAVSRSFSCSS
eukprot:XP_001706993.1 Hypothetical protein GL50803_34330 [Giardia lamblia ATCC 50803]